MKKNEWKGKNGRVKEEREGVSTNEEEQRWVQGPLTKKS